MSLELSISIFLLWFLTLEYTQIGTDEALPLGEEFQEHIRCFVKLSEKKIMRQFALVGKIIQQLGWVFSVLLTKSYGVR